MKKNLIILSAGLLLVACGKKEEAAAPVQTDAPVEALVSVVKAADTVFTHYLDIQGNVDTRENLIIFPEFSGTLLTLNVTPGQRVSKGQILGRIEDGGLSQQVSQLETQAALAKTTFERQKRLWDQKIGSEMQYLQAETNMISQQKAVQQARAQLAKTIIKAPISGTVDEILTDRGQVVAPGQGIVRIVNLSNMYVSSQVPEAYVGKIKVGTPVKVDITSLNKIYDGKIRQVANNINPANRSFGIEIAVPNNDNLLRPNQVAKLKIADYSKTNAVVVPSNVILQDSDGKQYVFVVDNAGKSSGTAKKVSVTSGLTANNLTEITSGLKGGEMVISEGANSVSEGMKVNF